MLSAADVIQAARDWIDTPYAHQGRKKGVGVDCAGLVICVARELGIVEPTFDINGYAPTPDGESLLNWCNRLMTPVKEDEMAPGDVIVVRWSVDPQHLGIVGDYRHGGLSIIHALGVIDHRKKGRVLETRMAGAWRFVAAYRFPGVQ